MASGSLYQDDDSGITDINVTPFVDVLLVLLVVFMVTAKLIVARGVVVDKPKASTGGDVQSTLRVEVTWDEMPPGSKQYASRLIVNGQVAADPAAAVAQIRDIASKTDKSRAIIVGDKDVPYDKVMNAIDLAYQAGVRGIALENVRMDVRK